MERRTKLMIAGGAVIVVGGLILWKRRQVGAAVTTAAEKTVEKAKEVVKSVVLAAGPISPAVLKNFATHNLANIIERTRGNLPWALAAAIVEIESGGDPYVYNFKKDSGGYGVGHWKPGTPLPTNSHANGLMQILTKYTLDKTPKGYPVTLAETYDPEKAAKAAFDKINSHYKAAKAAGLTGNVLNAMTYFGHNQGGGALKKALAAAATGDVAQMVKQAGVTAKAATVALKVAAHALEWGVIEQKVRSGNLSAALGSIVVGKSLAQAPVYNGLGRLVGFADVLPQRRRRRDASCVADEQ